MLLICIHPNFIFIFLVYYNLPVIYKAPCTLYEKRQNVQLCLEVLKGEGVKLNGINCSGDFCNVFSFVSFWHSFVLFKFCV